jgi:hypothetical protein
MSEPFGELALVVVIVAAVVVLGIRALYRVLAGQNSGKCCGCSSCTFEDTDRKTE